VAVEVVGAVVRGGDGKRERRDGGNMVTVAAVDRDALRWRCGKARWLPRVGFVAVGDGRIKEIAWARVYPLWTRIEIMAVTLARTDPTLRPYYSIVVTGPRNQPT
jgi:hypothetical protein